MGMMPHMIKQAIQDNVTQILQDALYLRAVANTAKQEKGVPENVLVLTTSARILVDAHRLLAKQIATEGQVDANPYQQLRRILTELEHASTH